MIKKPVVLFLCTGNSCRSQMAEGWLRTLHGGLVEARSAGIVAHGLNPYAVQVMADAGVDITGQASECLDAHNLDEIELVVSVCGNARESCPVLPREVLTLHVPFDDPPALAREAADDEAALACYRRVRDEIRKFVAMTDFARVCAG
ncbi:MAG TPA: arsenate reductase [Lentisphaeria bacterium]|jgi:arsenate reductase|nr:arsenate reductase [Lentisphaeria bacterium]